MVLAIAFMAEIMAARRVSIFSRVVFFTYCELGITKAESGQGSSGFIPSRPTEESQASEIELDVIPTLVHVLSTR